jgi:hypothetical protein
MLQRSEIQNKEIPIFLVMMKFLEKERIKQYLLEVSCYYQRNGTQLEVYGRIWVSLSSHWASPWRRSFLLCQEWAPWFFRVSQKDIVHCTRVHPCPLAIPLDVCNLSQGCMGDLPITYEDPKSHPTLHSWTYLPAWADFAHSLLWVPFSFS